MNKEKLTTAGLEPATSGQSGGRRFKSRSSQFFFVHPNLSKICTQSVSLVVYYMINIINIIFLPISPGTNFIELLSREFGLNINQTTSQNAYAICMKVWLVTEEICEAIFSGKQFFQLGSSMKLALCDNS